MTTKKPKPKIPKKVWKKHRAKELRAIGENPGPAQLEADWLAYNELCQTIFQRFCRRCEKLYTPTGKHSKFCEDCKKPKYRGKRNG